MKKKIKSLVKGTIIGAALGLQRANEEMMGQSAASKNSDGGIVQKQQAQNLGEALMQGEVTQEVENLRWRTYAVEREAKKLDYIKMTGHEKKLNVPVIIQENKPVVGTVLDALQTNTIKEEWNIRIGWKTLPRFKIERFLKFVRIDKREKTITFIFDSLPDANYTTSAAFMAQLKKVAFIKNEIDASRNDIVSSIASVAFITYKCVGMEDFYEVCVTGISYKDGKLNYQDDGKNIHFTLVFDDYHEENLMTEYSAPELEEKYKNKEKRELDLDMGNITYNEDKTEVITTCDVCGAKVDDYTASISHYQYGQCLCMKCYAEKEGIDLEAIQKDQNVIHGIKPVDVTPTKYKKIKP